MRALAELGRVRLGSNVGEKVRQLPHQRSQRRELLSWLFFEERDKDAICRQLKIDRNYLRVLLHRAKARFRQEFERAGMD